MSNIAESIVNAIDRAIAGKRPASGHPFAFSMAAIVEEAGKTLISPEDLETLRQHQRNHDAARERINSHCDPDAKRAWTQQSAELTRGMGTGEYKGDGDAWSLQDFMEDYEEIRNASKQQQVQITEACLPIAEKAGNKFAAVARKLADQVEATEKSIADRFGVPFSPSQAVQRIRACADVAVSTIAHRKAAPYPSNISPKYICPYLDI